MVCAQTTKHFSTLGESSSHQQGLPSKRTEDEERHEPVDLTRNAVGKAGEGKQSQNFSSTRTVGSEQLDGNTSNAQAGETTGAVMSAYTLSAVPSQPALFTDIITSSGASNAHDDQRTAEARERAQAVTIADTDINGSRRNDSAEQKKARNERDSMNVDVAEVSGAKGSMLPENKFAELLEREIASVLNQEPTAAPIPGQDLPAEADTSPFQSTVTVGQMNEAPSPQPLSASSDSTQSGNHDFLSGLATILQAARHVQQTQEEQDMLIRSGNTVQAAHAFLDQARQAYPAVAPSKGRPTSAFNLLNIDPALRSTPETRHGNVSSCSPTDFGGVSYVRNRPPNDKENDKASEPNHLPFSLDISMAEASSIFGTPEMSNSVVGHNTHSSALPQTDNITDMSDFLAQLAKQLQQAQQDASVGAANANEGPSSVSLSLPPGPGIEPSFEQYSSTDHPLHVALHEDPYYQPGFEGIHRETQEVEEELSPIDKPDDQLPPTTELESPPHKKSKKKSKGKEKQEEVVSEKPTSRKPRKEKAIHPCNFCPKTFGRRSDLLRHLKIHTGERPYNCTEPGCGKRFIQQSALNVHLRTHTGERPLKCEYEDCGATFGDSSALARHRKIHTGVRPHRCIVIGCGKAFTRRTTLSQHVFHAHNGDWGVFPEKALEVDEEEQMDVEIEKSVKSLTTLLARAKGDNEHAPQATTSRPNDGRTEPLESHVAAISANIAAAIVQAQKQIAEDDDDDDDEEDDNESDDGAEMDVLGPLVSGIRDELLRPARREAEGTSSGSGNTLLDVIAGVELERASGQQKDVEVDDIGIDFAVPLRERRAEGQTYGRGGASVGQKRKR